MEIEDHKPDEGKFPKGILMLLYGAPKVGKSSFAATMDNSLIFDMESGYENIECSRVRPRNLTELKKNLKDKTLDKFDTIVIDTLDVVYGMIEEETIDRLNRQFKTGYDFIGSFPMGNGWSSAKNAMKNFILKDLTPLMRKDKNVVLIAHEKAETIKRKGEDDTIRYQIALPGQTAVLVCSMADVIGRCYIKKDTPFMSFSPSRDLGGSRIKALAGREIPLNFAAMKRLIENDKSKRPEGIAEIVDEQEDSEW